MSWHAALTAALLGLGLVAGLAASAPAAEQRTVETWWQGVEEFDKAQVENAMDAAVRRPGKSGGVSMPAVFLHPVNEGRAVLSYPPFSTALAGERVFFLGYAGIADGFEWGEAEHPADGARFYVLVDGKEVATAHLEESRWVPLAAELRGPTAEQEVFEPRMALATDSGPAGNSNYDWAMFGEPIVVSVEGQALAQGTAVTGASGVLVARVRSGEGRLVVEGLNQAGDPVEGAQASVQVSQPTDLSFVRFDFSASVECVQWRWRAEGVTVAAAWGGSWQPHLVMDTLGPSQAVTFAGEGLRVRAAVRNTGPGPLLPEHEAYVECRGERRPVERLAAGETATVEFDLGPPGLKPDQLEAVAVCGKRAIGRIVGGEPLVWPQLPDLPAARPQRARAQQLNDDYLLLENPICRWVVNKKHGGLGALVYVWTEKGWELAGAVAPWVETAETAEGSGTPAFSTVSARQADGVVRLEAEGTGKALDYAVTAELADDSPALRVEVAVAARERTGLTALWGPAVHAGDRGTRTDKGIAIFPGLEYLDGEERSSSTRDLAPPLNERWAPHKFKITVPMMVVETRDGGPVMGVAWDPGQRWDGEHAQPGARFASPDFLMHQDNHFMQLMLPSVPDFVPESGERASEPVTIERGGSWRLVQHIVAGKPDPDVTGAYEWFEELVGYPEAEAWPRSFDEEIALCRHGFMVTVWDEETKKSRHCVGWGPGNSPGMATLLLMDGRAVAKGEEARRVLERVRLIGEQTVREEGDPGLASSRNCHTMAWEFPYHGAGLDDAAEHLVGALVGMRAAAHGALDSQEEDGGWGYYPDAERRDLGEPGTRVMGIAGRNAYLMAKWVAVSGDPAVEAGLRKALAHMGRHRVPRGAQGWECPILEPDVLASAYAVRAYVWSYMALGEEQWLDRARLWARTGVPFQYTWDDGEHPGMRYASIPVFGSTFFRHSWIGLPVQWCGLVYAYALQELRRFDDNDLWRKQVEGILASAVHQQWPMDNQELAGSYPDSYGNWFTRRNGAYINPENIALNALALRGLDPGLRSQRVEVTGGPVHVTAPADLRTRGEGGTVEVDLKYLPNEVVYLTVAPVRPVEEGLRTAGDVAETAYDEGLRALAVGVKCNAQGVGRVTLEGLERSLPEPPETRGAWDFDEGTEGWTGANACNVVGREGSLVITVTGEDPYAVSGPASLPSRLKTVRMRARLSAGNGVALFWRSTVSAAWGEDKHVTVAVPPGGQWQEVVFDLGEEPLWAGTILQLRLDVEPADVAPGTTLEVDWIRPE